MKLRPFFLVVIILTLISRLALLGTGAISSPDEDRYIRSYIGLQALVEKGNVSSFCSNIVINRGIPTNQIIQLIPNSIQLVLQRATGLHPENPASLLIAQAFGFLVFLIIVFLFFKILVLLTGDATYALGITAVLVLFTNMSIYARHLYPYENALMMSLLCIYYFLRSDFEKNPFRAFVLGLLCSLTFGTYPGFYFLPALIAGTFVLHRSNWRDFKNLVKLAIFFVAGFLTVTIGFEIIARIGHTSYIMSLKSSAELITQGDYSQGFSFVPIYLYEVEGASGVAILSLSCLSLALAVRAILSRRAGNFESIILMAFAGILFHASQCYFLHKMVWYGRLVHFYVPLLVISSSYLGYRFMQMNPRKNWVLVGFIVVGISHFAPFMYTMLFQVGYPKNMLYDNRVNTVALSADHFINKFEMTNNIDKVPDYAKSYKSVTCLPPAYSADYYSQDTNFTLINCAFIWPDKEKPGFPGPVHSDPAYHLVASAPYFATYTPYLFEGFNKAERVRMNATPTVIEIYKYAPVK